MTPQSTQAELKQLTELCVANNQIDTSLYSVYDVKRGLRDINGKGVLAGLTNISNIHASKIVDGVRVPDKGILYYRGYDVSQLVRNCVLEHRSGFEEVTYLLLFGKLPTVRELADFKTLLSNYRALPLHFARDVIMRRPSADMMNGLANSVLALYSYDDNPDAIDPENVLRQCLQLIARMPLMAVYSYHSHMHFNKNQSLYIGNPDPALDTAENILKILRPDGKYTMLEARVLDIALILHAEHGGGNNSTFTTHVVSSSGTDTYSAIAAALGSLKGPRHGGANVKVTQMFNDMKETIKDWTDDEEICRYLSDVLDKKAFDRSGLIYGMGHAVYSISDPRALIFKSFLGALSEEKHRNDEFAFYSRIEELAPQVIGKKRKIYKGVSANVDFYSGFAYQMLDLPMELYTPFFAISRIAGWSAHRLEELINVGKIVRPTYQNVCPEQEYIPLDQR